MTDAARCIADQQASLEAVRKGEVLRMYQEVADHPEAEFHWRYEHVSIELSVEPLPVSLDPPKTWEDMER